jgi:hypothetical protein
MNTLLVKDLSRVEELDREAARAVRGGMQTIAAANNPSWLKLPVIPAPPSIPSMPALPVGGGCGGPVIHPEAQQDPRLL